MEPLPQDHHHDLIRKLVAIKRHELPPPGFFDQFHARTMSRIAAELEEGQLSWWERGLLLFDSKGFMAGAYAVAVAGLFVCGLSFSQMIQTDTAEFEIGGSSMVSAQPIQEAAFTVRGFGGATVPLPLYPAGVTVTAGTSEQARIIPEQAPAGPPAFLFNPSELTTRSVSDGPFVR